jgi:adenylosuccinate synthase
MSVVVLLDAGYGDNGKGKIANEWARRGHFDVVVDGGSGPSAAHCLRSGDREFWYHQIPSGWLGKRTELMIGPGVLVDPDLILAELGELRDFDVAARLTLDPRCGLLTDEHRAADIRRFFEGGCATARSEQVLGTLPIAADSSLLTPYLGDVPRAAAAALESGKRVLVCGAHGHGYDPHRTPGRTRATSESCGSAATLTRAGLAAGWPVTVVGVVGAVTTTVIPEVPLLDELQSAEIRARGLLSYGKVSGLPRRVAPAPQWSVLEDFVALERPSGLVLGRTDLYEPSCRDCVTVAGLPHRVRELVDTVQKRTGTPVVGVSTGPDAGAYVALIDSS